MSSPALFPREMRRLTTIPRWAIFPCIVRQSIADHTYLVAMYSAQICGWLSARGYEMYPATVAEVLMYALNHDLDEILSGDVTPPAKAVMKEAAGENWKHYEEWADKEIKARMGYSIHTDSEAAKKIVKLADLVEAILYCVHEERMGNQNFKEVKVQLEFRLGTAIDALAAKFGMNEPHTMELNKLVQESILEARRPDALVGAVHAAF